MSYPKRYNKNDAKTYSLGKSPFPVKMAIEMLTRLTGWATMLADATVKAVSGRFEFGK